MKHFNYPVDLLTEDDGVTVTFPDIPECITCGDTIDEALFHAKDALETVLFDMYIDDDKLLPVPSEPKQEQHTVTLDMQGCLKLHLYAMMKHKNVKLAYIAQELNMPWNNAKRMLTRRYNSKMDKYEAAFKVLGTVPHISLDFIK
jgi:antitoxin HicB